MHRQLTIRSAHLMLLCRQKPTNLIPIFARTVSTTVPDSNQPNPSTIESNPNVHKQQKRKLDIASDDKYKQQMPLSSESNQSSGSNINQQQGNKKRKRPFRRPKPHPRGDQQMHCTPFAESINLEELLKEDLFRHQFDINQVTAPGEIETETADTIAIHCQYRNQPPKLLGEGVGDQAIIREFYVFKDGVVVFWNIDEPDRAHIMSHLKNFAKNLFAGSLKDSEEDFMNIEFTRNPAQPSHAGCDTIHLNRDHLEPIHFNNFSPFDASDVVQERFAFSHAMAASVRMGILEAQLEELGDELGECIDKMKSKGELAWKTGWLGYVPGLGKGHQKKPVQMIGQIASIRQSVNTTDLLDKDIYWDLRYPEKMYDSLAEHLNLNKRREILNERINYCENFLTTVHEMLNQEKSHVLEWIIIVLIAVEVVINLDKIWDLVKRPFQWVPSKLEEWNRKRQEVVPKPPPDPEAEFAITWKDRALTLIIYPVLFFFVAVIVWPDTIKYMRKWKLFKKRGYKFTPRKKKVEKTDDWDD